MVRGTLRNLSQEVLDEDLRIMEDHMKFLEGSHDPVEMEQVRLQIHPTFNINGSILVVCYPM